MADIKDKIAKLLALAESPEPEEAKAALLRARALMAEHKLRPEECVKAENVTVVNELVGVTCTAMTNPWAVALSAVIAENYCCCAFRRRAKGRKYNEIGLIGLSDDFEICKRIFLYAYDCVISACKRDIERSKWDDPGDYRKKCNAYGWGFVAGVKKAFDEQKEQHQEWGLVLSTPAPVAAVFNTMGKPTQFGKVQDESWLGKYRAKGYVDGTKFDPTHRVAAGPERAAIGGAV